MRGSHRCRRLRRCGPRMGDTDYRIGASVASAQPCAKSDPPVLGRELSRCLEGNRAAILRSVTGIACARRTPRLRSVRLLGGTPPDRRRADGSLCRSVCRRPTVGLQPYQEGTGIWSARLFGLMRAVRAPPMASSSRPLRLCPRCSRLRRRWLPGRACPTDARSGAGGGALRC